MNFLTKLLIIFIFIIESSVNATSLPEWKIIPEESSLTFTATQNGAPVTGEFKSFTGQIFVDPADYKSSSINIVVDISSLSVPYEDLKTTLLTADWFNLKQFPKAEFKATDFTQLKEKTYQANGTLTIRNKSVPVSLVFTAEEVSSGKAVVEGNANLKRNDFGVGQGEWASTNEIKDEVTVHFKLTAVRKPAVVLNNTEH